MRCDGGVFLTAVLVIGGFAAATGAIPGGDQVISGCFVKATGALRVIDADAAQKCKSNEAPLSWNQVGLKGEPGDVGPAGPAGEQGPAGEAGASAAQEVFFAWSNAVSFISGEVDVITKDLPAGSYLIEAQVSISATAQPTFPRGALCWITWDGKRVGSEMEWQVQPDDKPAIGFSSTTTTFEDQIQLKVAATRSAGTVGVRCFPSSNVAEVSSRGVNLTATRVASVG